MKFSTFKPCHLISFFLPFLLLAWGQTSMWACNAPILLNTFDVTTDGASLTWTSVSTPPGAFFELEIVPQGQGFSGIPTYSGISNPPYLVNGLTAGIQYQFRVRTVCSPGDNSSWSTSRKFRTDLSNPSLCPLNLTLADTTCDPATNQFEIQVSNAPGNTLGSDVFLKAVRLVVAHTWLDDLTVALTAPDGTRIILVDSLGTGEDNFGNPNAANCGQWTEFTAECNGVSIYSPQAKAPYIGAYLPKQPLSIFNTGGLANGLWKLELCDSGADDVGALRYVELVFYRPDCRPPSGIAVNNITLSTASVFWTQPLSGCDSVIVEYGLQGFVPGKAGIPGSGGALVKIPCHENPPYELTGLQQLSNYEVYVRRVCGNDVYSDNSCVAHFFTDCALPSLEQNFDTLANCSSNCGAPCPISGIFTNVTTGDQFDWTVYNGPTPTATTGPEADASGSGRYAYIETSGVNCTGGKSAILRSKCILVDAEPGGCHMSFAWHMYGATTGSLRLEISTNAGQSWTTLFLRSGNQGNQWTRQYIDLSAYHGQIAVFRFVGVGGNGPYGDIGLDNIRFFGSTDAGVPDYIFYADLDLDGFGDASKPLSHCSPVPPPGYVANNQDCNDQSASIAPGKPEILCDQIDQNCNGMEDDQAIPSPLAPLPVSVCSGEPVIFEAPGNPLGQYYWFDSPFGGTPISVGKTLSIPQATTSATYYLTDSLPGSTTGCASDRIPVQLTVHPVPVLGNLAARNICFGGSLDLSAIPIIDFAQTNGSISFHDDFPPQPTNRLGSPVVAPQSDFLYHIVSTTTFGCMGSTSVWVEVNDLPDAEILNGDSLAVCLGAVVNLNGLGGGTGVPPFGYSWNTGLNFQNITLPPRTNPGATDTVVLTVTDQKGCTATDTITISTLPSITQTQISAVQHVTACGGSDGAILLTPVNGFSPYRFDWEGPSGTTGAVFPVSGTGSITGLTQGLYRITITDFTTQGCSMVLPLITINAPGLTAEIDTIMPSSCYGSADGGIALSVQGTHPVFSWSNAVQTEDNLFIPRGTYAVTISDGACNVVFQGLQVTEPAPLAVTANLIKPVTCYGQSDGAVDVIISGGIPPYSTLWSNDQTTEDLLQAPAGAFSNLVIDAHGCILESQPFYITEPPELNLSIQAETPVSCYNGDNGFLLLQAAGGAGDYHFNWESGQSGPLLSGLEAGMYSATVTDKNGCVDSLVHTLANPDSLYFFQVTVENPPCQGPNTGAIYTNVVGGSGNYQFLWSQGGTGPSASSLAPGVYQVTVVDSKGCTDVAQNLTITAPQVLDMHLDTLAPVHCYGDFNGTAGISITGGAVPYTVYWNFDVGGLYRDDLPGGILRIRIRDVFGCEYLSDSILIEQPEAPLALMVNAVENPVCFNDFGGSIDIEPVGGTGPFTFLWSNGVQTEDLTEIRSGAYAVQATDARGCTSVSDTFTITEPAPIEVSVYKEDVPCFGPQAGLIDLDVTGGVPPYQYHWSSGQNTEDIQNISNGIYDVTITDYIGCEKVLKSITIYKSSDDFVAASVDIRNVSCHGQHDGQLVVKAVGGTGPYYFNWSPPGGLHFGSNPTDTLAGMNGGNFVVTITDNTGCVAVSDTLFVQESPPVVLYYQDLQNPECAGSSTGSISSFVSGGLQPYQFAWSNGASTQNLTGVSAGCYALTVTDFNGCITAAPQTCLEDEGAPLVIALDGMNGAITHDNCASCKGAIHVEVSGGIPGYTYSWSNFEEIQDIFNLCPGEYALTVWDQNGCSVTSPVFEVLENPDPLRFDSVHITDVRCFGEFSGAVETFAGGGTPPYHYLWNQNSLSDTLLHLSGGNYTVTLSDAVGCSLVYGVVVDAPDSSLQVEFMEYQEPGGTWCVTALVEGGVSPYHFNWSTQDTTATVCSLATGNYGLTVTDWRGCPLIINPVHVPVDLFSPEIGGGFALMPNPASNYFRLENRGFPDRSFSVAAFNLLGVKVYDSSRYAPADQFINTSDWPQGIYKLKVLLDDGRWGVLWVVVGE